MSLFGSVGVCIYITKKKVFVTDSIAAKPIIKELPWDGISLLEVCKQIKSAYKATTMYVVLGNDVSYVACALIATTPVTIAGVTTIAAGLFPISIDSQNICWHVVESDNQTGSHLLQLMATEKVFLTMLSKAAQQASISIATIQSSSLLLAADTSTVVASPHFILWSGEEMLLSLSYKGRVYLCENTSANIQAQVLQMQSYAKEFFGLHVDQLIIDHPQATELVPLIPEIKTTQKIMEPITKIRTQVIEKQPKGINLTLTPITNEPSTNVVVSTNTKESPSVTGVPKNKIKDMLIVIFLAVVIVGAVVIVILKVQGAI